MPPCQGLAMIGFPSTIDVPILVKAPDKKVPIERLKSNPVPAKGLKDKSIIKTKTFNLKGNVA